LGGFILTGATLLFLFVVGYSLRVSYQWMRSLWSGVRQSPFFAGLVTAGCLVASATVLLVGHAFGQVASALSVPQTAQALEACSGSADCSRRVLVDAIAGQPRAPASLPAGPYVPEQNESFEQCAAALREPESGGWSTIDRALFEVNSIINDQEMAKDLVHGTLLTVCLKPERIYAIKPYFMRSAINAARTQWRKNRQTCPIVIDDGPVWLGDGCVARSVEQQYIQIEMETAAQLALCSLSNEDRRLIVWHAQQGLSHAQIAKKLGIKEDAVRKRYSRALDALREQFDQRCR
jgi:RNA polymerase sigma factor (sigma-70 family)